MGFRNRKPIRCCGGNESSLLAGFLVLLAVLLLGGCSPGRAWESLLVLQEIAARDGKPGRLQRTRPPPRRSALEVRAGGESFRADLYRPGEPAGGTLLLIPGAAEAGKDDPRLVAFAETLARARFNVLVPDLPDLRGLRVTPANVDQIRELFAWLSGPSQPAGAGPFGLVAFSYAAGPALLAALEEPVRAQLDFLLAVGPYYDLEEVLVFFATGWFEHEGRWRHREPNAYGKWIFVHSNLPRLESAADRRLLGEMAERKLRDLQAPVADLAAGLSGQGKTVYRFLTSSDPQQARELLGRFPEGILEDVRALDLSGRDLDRLRARLYLLHGRDDPIIPFDQSVELAAAVPEERVRLYLVHGLAHVDVEPGLRDRLRLWRAVYRLLGEREGI